MTISQLSVLVHNFTITFIWALLIELLIIMVVYAVAVHHVPSEEYDSIRADKSRFNVYLHKFGLVPFLILNAMYLMGAYYYGF